MFNAGNYRGEVSIGFIDDGDWQITCEDEIIFINPGSKTTQSCILFVPRSGSPLTEISFVGEVTSDIENRLQK